MNTKKKIMILGASILQLPAIRKAKEMGLYVIALDMDRNAIGFKEADTCLEISTIDIDKAVSAAIEHEVDGVITLATDMPIRTVAAIAKALDIVGINEETALNATSKSSMRECLKKSKVPIPKFLSTDDYHNYLSSIDAIEGKVIVKPSDSSGSRGVFLLIDKSNKEMVDYAWNYSKRYSRSGKIMIEEFMEGPEVSVETLSVNGEVHIIAITDKLTTGAPRFVEMGHSQPSRLSVGIKKQIEEVAMSAVKAIGIENGPSHTEIIVTREGPKIVELGARLGGDNITTHLVPLSTGVDMVRSCIEIAMGSQTDVSKKYDKGSAIRYFRTSSGLIKNISGVDKALSMPGVVEIHFTKNIGDLVGDVNSSVDRIGFVIAQAENADTAINICEEAIGLIEITVDNEGHEL